jgi:hypothetical protein
MTLSLLDEKWIFEQRVDPPSAHSLSGKDDADHTQAFVIICTACFFVTKLSTFKHSTLDT